MSTLWRLSGGPVVAPQRDSLTSMLPWAGTSGMSQGSLNFFAEASGDSRGVRPFCGRTLLPMTVSVRVIPEQYISDALESTQREAQVFAALSVKRS